MAVTVAATGLPGLAGLRYPRRRTAVMGELPLAPSPEPGPKVTAGDPFVMTQELLRLAKAGDPQALDALMSRYLPRLQRWASGRLPPWARSLLDTSDLVQETL